LLRKGRVGVIPSPRLTLWLDEVAVADCGAAMDLAPGEARALDGKLIGRSPVRADSRKAGRPVLADAAAAEVSRE